MLDVDTSAVTAARAFGLADEAMAVLCTDKLLKLEDEEKDRVTARRTVNNIARARGEEPVVDLPPPGTQSSPSGARHSALKFVICRV